MSAVDYIIKKTMERYVDYSAAIDNRTTISDSANGAAICFVVAARGRSAFVPVLYEHFDRARRKFSNGRVVFTLVEHSESPELKKMLPDKGANYIHIPSRQDEPFNKCLAYNVGAISSGWPELFLFHDLDIIMKDDFFETLYQNCKDIDIKAIQCYTKRRVLSCDKTLTDMILNGEKTLDNLQNDSDGVSELPSGSTGGSIMVKASAFYDVGGFDPEFFHSYAPEDLFFWKKILTKFDMHYADSPPIELYHLWHESMSGLNKDYDEMDMIFRAFNGMENEDRMRFLEFKKTLFSPLLNVKVYKRKYN